MMVSGRYCDLYSPSTPLVSTISWSITVSPWVVSNGWVISLSFGWCTVRFNSGKDFLLICIPTLLISMINILFINYFWDLLIEEVLGFSTIFVVTLRIFDLSCQFPARSLSSQRLKNIFHLDSNKTLLQPPADCPVGGVASDRTEAEDSLLSPLSHVKHPGQAGLGDLSTIFHVRLRL